MINPGESVHIQSGYYPDGLPAFHRFLVLTQPYKNTKEIILINFTTLRGRRGEDKTTIFRAEEIDFLRSDSYVFYNGAKLLTISELKAKIKEGTAKMGMRGVSNDQRQRILDGIRRSRRTPIEVEEAYERFLEYN